MRRVLSVRQQKYKQNRLAGMNVYNAARAAGYSHTYANNRGKQLDGRGMIGLKDAFEQAGLTDKAIVRHALDGLTATRKSVSSDGDQVEIPDWPTRHKYFETITKLTDRLKEHTAEPIKPIINIINYAQAIGNNDPSSRISAEPIRIRDFEVSGQVQEHQLASPGAQDDSGAQQVN
jgi:hypothetical protein